jgi:hypothetical protein
VAPLKTAQLVAAVARVTGDDGKACNEGKRFRVVVRSTDGHRVGVSVQVDTHPKETRPYQLKQIARQWCLDHNTIMDVLDTWGPDDLLAHLARFSKAELMPPNYHR